MMPNAHFINPDITLSQAIVWAHELGFVYDFLSLQDSNGIVPVNAHQQYLLAQHLRTVIETLKEVVNDAIEAEDKFRNTGYTKAEAALAGVKA